MKIMLDTKSYTHKPESEIGIVTKRIMQYPVDITPQQLTQEILKGKSFIPAYIGTPNSKGVVKKSNECWTYQELLCLDFDEGMMLKEALEEFNNTAMFIYTTFNHSVKQDKFRVVFQLDKKLTNYKDFSDIITYLIDKYKADIQCKDGSRLYFGGKEVYELNYNNKLNVDELLIVSREYVSNKSKNNNKNKNVRKSTHHILDMGSKYLSNIQRVLKSHHEKLTRNRTTEAKEITNKLDLMGYLLSRDLYTYLNIEDGLTPFCCIFHDDKKPSASIIKNQKGFQIYKCHSSKCGFTGNIFRITERLFELNNVEAIDYLCDVFNVQLVESEWYQKQKRIYEQNIYYLLSGAMEYEHEYLYKVIKRHIPLLVILNQIAIMTMGSEMIKRNEEPIFFKPMKEIMNMFAAFVAEIKEIEEKDKKFTRDLKELNKRINLFALLGVVNKLHISDVPTDIYKRYTALQKQVTGDEKLKIPNFYYIPSYSDQVLTSANQLADQFKQTMSMKGFSREMIMRAMGEDAANRVFPMKKGKELTKTSDKLALEMKDLVLSLLDDKGYVIEKEIFDYTYGSKEKNLRVLKRCLQEMLDEYGLKRVRLNKELKNGLGIVVEGYPNVILRDSE